MSAVPLLGPPPKRITVQAHQVRRLIGEQFPQWSDLQVRPVREPGWDNWTFHLGESMSVRLPSAAEYALAVDKEHRWLPELAPRLPQRVPVPLGKGRPGAGYPFAWSVYPWLDGEPAQREAVADPVRFATDLADFLLALQAIDADAGPRPGTHNWFRGGTLRTFDPLVQDALDVLRDLVDAVAARDVWAAALDADEAGRPVWVHGDVAAGNLLLRNGELSAVIDFGTCGVGDPSCDLAVAWTLMDDAGRQVFRDRLRVGGAMWARGRGWALWKALTTCARSARDDAGEGARARRALTEIFAEFGSSA